MKHVCGPLRPIARTRGDQCLQTSSRARCGHIGTCMHRAVEIEAWFVQYFVAMALRELPDSAHCMESSATLAGSTTGVFVMDPVAESSSPIDTCAVVRACLGRLGQMSYNRGYAFLQLARLGSILRRNCLSRNHQRYSRRVHVDILLALRLSM